MMDYSEVIDNIKTETPDIEDKPEYLDLDDKSILRFALVQHTDFVKIPVEKRIKCEIEKSDMGGTKEINIFNQEKFHIKTETTENFGYEHLYEQNSNTEMIQDDCNGKNEIGDSYMETKNNVHIFKEEIYIKTEDPCENSCSSKTSPRMVGKKGLIIHSQGREIVNNVSEFMKKEADEGISIPLTSHRRRTIAATKISKSTYQKIKNESERAERKAPSTSFVSPRKKRHRKSRKLGLLNSDHFQYIREIVYNIYILEKTRPTLKLILQKILDQEILTQPIGLTSLRHLLKKIGFRWQKTNDNRMAVVESHDIRIKRIKYLKELIMYRNEGRNIIYKYETFLDSRYPKEKGQFNGTRKGKRLTIVHAGGDNGFIDNGLLISHSGSKTNDCQDNMNHQSCIKWVETQLLPNMPPNSVLVVSNASYHNVPVEKITSTNKKSEMIAWLKGKNVSVDEKLTHPEMYAIIQHNKCKFPVKYKLDELLEKHGHKVLRLPVYHPELNPFEKIWDTVKDWVACTNNTCRLADVEGLIRYKFSKVTLEEWANIYQHVKKREQVVIEREKLFDTTFDSLKFTVNIGSSDESELESDCGENSDSSLE